MRLLLVVVLDGWARVRAAREGRMVGRYILSNMMMFCLMVLSFVGWLWMVGLRVGFIDPLSLHQLCHSIPRFVQSESLECDILTGNYISIRVFKSCTRESQATLSHIIHRK
jgi:hypothetical protein